MYALEMYDKFMGTDINEMNATENTENAKAPESAADADAAARDATRDDERFLKPRERNVNLDLLRIFAVLFIVINHLTINNLGIDGVTFSFISEGVVPQSALTTVLVSEFIDCFVIIGVNIFFLISGYFSIRFKLSKVFSLVIKVYIYFCVGELIAYLAGVATFDSPVDAVLECLTAPAKYWFILVYVAICVFAPLFNKFAEGLSRKGANYFAVVSLILFCFVGFIGDFFGEFIGTKEGYAPLWGFTVYIYGRLIALQKFGLKRKPSFWAVMYVVFTLLNYMTAAAITTASGNGKWAWHMYSYNNPLVLASSVAFSMIFITMRPTPASSKCAKPITTLAGRSLGVYLLHSNNPLISPYRAFMFDYCAPDTLWLQYVLLLPNVFILFVVLSLADFCFDKIFTRPIGAVAKLISDAIKRLYELIIKAASRIFNGKQDDPSAA